MGNSGYTSAVDLANSVNLADAQSSMLIIFGLLISVGVTLWGARMVAGKFRAK